MTFEERMEEARRFAILRILAEASQYRAGSRILYEVLQLRGPSTGYARVLKTLDWLAAAGFVTTEIFEGRDGEEPLFLASLTQSGFDIATGIETAEGIARPLPGEEWRG